MSSPIALVSSQPRTNWPIADCRQPAAFAEARLSWLGPPHLVDEREFMHPAGNTRLFSTPAMVHHGGDPAGQRGAVVGMVGSHGQVGSAFNAPLSASSWKKRDCRKGTGCEGDLIVTHLRDPRSRRSASPRRSGRRSGRESRSHAGAWQRDHPVSLQHCRKIAQILSPNGTWTSGERIAPRGRHALSFLKS